MALLFQHSAKTRQPKFREHSRMENTVLQLVCYVFSKTETYFQCKIKCHIEFSTNCHHLICIKCQNDHDNDTHTLPTISKFKLKTENCACMMILNRHENGYIAVNWENISIPKTNPFTVPPSLSFIRSLTKLLHTYTPVYIQCFNKQQHKVAHKFVYTWCL